MEHANSAAATARRLGRGGAFLAGAVVASVVTASTVVAATGAFTDVPDTHPFFDDIEAVAGACIAGGFADGTYKPASNVSRQAMAAFLNRTASKAVSGQKVGITNPFLGQAAAGASPTVPVAEVVVTVPDLPGDCMVPVEVHGQLSVSIQGPLADACVSSGCQTRGVLLKDGVVANDSLILARMFHDAEGAHFEPSYLFEQQDGTTATYTLAGQTFDVDDGGARVNAARNVFAVTHPMRATPAP